MSPNSWKTSIQPFHSVFCSFADSMVVSASNSQHSVNVKLLQSFWVIAIDSLFKKCPWKKVKVTRGLGTTVMKAMPNNVTTKEILQESHCCFGSMGGHPSLLKLAIPFNPFQHFQHSSELHQNFDNFTQQLSLPRTMFTHDFHAHVHT